MSGEDLGGVAAAAANITPKAVAGAPSASDPSAGEKVGSFAPAPHGAKSGVAGTWGGPRLNHPPPGLERLVEGRTDFFTELANSVSMEVQRLLRYTLLGYTTPRNPEQEMKAEADVHVALREILKRLAEYVDSAVTEIREAAGVVDEDGEEDEGRPVIDLSIIPKQVEKSMAVAEGLNKKLAAREDKINRLNSMIANMRFQYIQDLNSQRERCRALLLKHVGDVVPPSEMQKVLVSLGSVQFFNAGEFLDDDSRLAIRQNADALMEEFNIEREALLAKIQELTQSEAMAKAKYNKEVKKTEMLQDMLTEQDVKKVANAISIVDEDSAEPVSPTPVEVAADMEKQSTSPSKLMGRDEQKRFFEQISALENRHKEAVIALTSLRDLFAKQQAWIDGAGNKDVSVGNAMKTMKLFHREQVENCQQVRAVLEGHAMKFESSAAKQSFDAQIAANASANEQVVRQNMDEFLRQENDTLKGQIVEKTNNAHELEAQVQQLEANLKASEREVAQQKLQIEELAKVEEKKIHRLKHANTTLKMLKMLHRERCGSTSSAEDAGADSEAIAEVTPERIDESLSKILNEESEGLSTKLDIVQVELDAAQRTANKLKEDNARKAEEVQAKSVALEEAEEKLAQTQTLNEALEQEVQELQRAVGAPSVVKSQSEPEEKFVPKRERTVSDISTQTPDQPRRRNAEVSCVAGIQETGVQAMAARRGQRAGPHDVEAEIGWADEIRSPAMTASTPTRKNRHSSGSSLASPQHGPSGTPCGTCSTVCANDAFFCGHCGERQRPGGFGRDAAPAVVATHSVRRKMSNSRTRARVARADDEGNKAELDIKSHKGSSAADDDQPEVPRGKEVGNVSMSVVLHEVVDAVDLELPPHPAEGATTGDDSARIVKPHNAEKRDEEPTRDWPHGVNNQESQELEALQKSLTVAENQVKELRERVKTAPIEVQAQMEQKAREMEEQYLAQQREFNKRLAKVKAQATRMEREQMRSSMRNLVKGELKVEYEACLHRKVNEERARLYRAWPRTASADPYVPARDIKSPLKRSASIKHLSLHSEEMDEELFEARQEALRGIDAARLQVYSRAAREATCGADPRVTDIRTLLESKALKDTYANIGSLSKRLLAARGEHKRMCGRLAGSLFETDRLRMELGLLREAITIRLIDARVAWTRHTFWLNRCQAELERTGIGVPVPPALLAPLPGPDYAEDILRQELQTIGKGAGERGEREIARRLKRRRDRVRANVLAEFRNVMLAGTLDAFQLADALFVFHKLSDEESVVASGVKELEGAPEFANITPGAKMLLKRRTHSGKIADMNVIISDNAGRIDSIFDELEDREHKVLERYRETFECELLQRPPVKDFEKTLKQAAAAISSFNNTDYMWSLPAYQAAAGMEVSESSEEEETSPRNKEQQAKEMMANVVSHSLRRAERCISSVDEDSVERSPRGPRILSTRSSEYLKKAVAKKWDMLETLDGKPRLVHYVNMAKARAALNGGDLAESISTEVIESVEKIVAESKPEVSDEVRRKLNELFILPQEDLIEHLIQLSDSRRSELFAAMAEHQKKIIFQAFTEHSLQMRQKSGGEDEAGGDATGQGYMELLESWGISSSPMEREYIDDFGEPVEIDMFSGGEAIMVPKTMPQDLWDAGDPFGPTPLEGEANGFFHYTRPRPQPKDPPKIADFWHPTRDVDLEGQQVENKKQGTPQRGQFSTSSGFDGESNKGTEITDEDVAFRMRLVEPPNGKTPDLGSSIASNRTRVASVGSDGESPRRRTSMSLSSSLRAGEMCPSSRSPSPRNKSDVLRGTDRRIASAGSEGEAPQRRTSASSSPLRAGKMRPSSRSPSPRNKSDVLRERDRRQDPSSRSSMSPAMEDSELQDAVTLHFDELDFAKTDHNEFKRLLLDQLKSCGVSDSSLSQLRINLREGSIIAELVGNPKVVREVLERIANASIKVMGSIGSLDEVPRSRGASPRVQWAMGNVMIGVIQRCHSMGMGIERIAHITGLSAHEVEETLQSQGISFEAEREDMRPEGMASDVEGTSASRAKGLHVEAEDGVGVTVDDGLHDPEEEIGFQEVQPKEAQTKKTQSIEAKSVEAQANEAKPIEERPDQAQPIEAQPVESQPDRAQPKETQPQEAQQKEAQSKEAEPAQSKEAEPKEAQPNETQPNKAQLTKTPENVAQPQEAQPKEALPKEAQPKEPQPKEAQPNKTQPKEALPKEAQRVASACDTKGDPSSSTHLVFDEDGASPASVQIMPQSAAVSTDTQSLTPTTQASKQNHETKVLVNGHSGTPHATLRSTTARTAGITSIIAARIGGLKPSKEVRHEVEKCSCGNALASDDSFCRKCGEPTSSKSAREVRQPKTTAAVETQTSMPFSVGMKVAAVQTDPMSVLRDEHTRRLIKKTQTKPSPLRRKPLSLSSLFRLALLAHKLLPRTSITTGRAGRRRSTRVSAGSHCPQSEAAPTSELHTLDENTPMGASEPSEVDVPQEPRMMSRNMLLSRSVVTSTRSAVNHEARLPSAPKSRKSRKGATFAKLLKQCATKYGVQADVDEGAAPEADGQIDENATIDAASGEDGPPDPMLPDEEAAQAEDTAPDDGSGTSDDDDDLLIPGLHSQAEEHMSDCEYTKAHELFELIQNVEPGYRNVEERLTEIEQLEAEDFTEVVDCGQQCDLKWDSLPDDIINWLKMNLLFREQAEMYCTPLAVIPLEGFPTLSAQKQEKIIRDVESFITDVMCRLHPTKHEMRKNLRRAYRAAAGAAQQRDVGDPESQHHCMLAQETPDSEGKSQIFGNLRSQNAELQRQVEVLQARIRMGERHSKRRFVTSADWQTEPRRVTRSESPHGRSRDQEPEVAIYEYPIWLINGDSSADEHETFSTSVGGNHAGVQKLRKDPFDGHGKIISGLELSRVLNRSKESEKQVRNRVNVIDVIGTKILDADTEQDQYCLAEAVKYNLEVPAWFQKRLKAGGKSSKPTEYSPEVTAWMKRVETAMKNDLRSSSAHPATQSPSPQEPRLARIVAVLTAGVHRSAAAGFERLVSATRLPTPPLAARVVVPAVTLVPEPAMPVQPRVPPDAPPTRQPRQRFWRPPAHARVPPADTHATSGTDSSYVGAVCWSMERRGVPPQNLPQPAAEPEPEAPAGALWGNSRAKATSSHRAMLPVFSRTAAGDVPKASHTQTAGWTNVTRAVGLGRQARTLAHADDGPLLEPSNAVAGKLPQILAAPRKNWETHDVRGSARDGPGWRYSGNA